MYFYDLLKLLIGEVDVTFMYADSGYAICKLICDIDPDVYYGYKVIRIIQNYGGTPCYVIDLEL